MQIGRVLNATRVLGKSAGFLGLPIRDEVVDGQPCMTSCWHPTPAELAALNAGAPVRIKILGTQHPPIMVDTGDIPG